MNNSNPIPQIKIEFKINSITAAKEANQILFSKFSGEFSRQIILTRINPVTNKEVTEK